MSQLVGWSEANGRRWVRKLEEYIPSVSNGNKIMYNDESLRIMKFFKRMSDEGFTMEEVKSIVEKYGVPVTSVDEDNLLRKNKDGIPTTKNILIPYLKMIRDKEKYTASEITEKLVAFFNLSDKQRLMKYEGGSDSIFLTRIRSARYSLKKVSVK